MGRSLMMTFLPIALARIFEYFRPHEKLNYYLIEGSYGLGQEFDRLRRTIFRGGDDKYSAVKP